MKKLVALNENGRVIGQEHPLAKLLDWEVDQVHDLLESGFSLQHVADKFGVSKSCVQKIANGSRRSQTPTRWVEVAVSVSEKG